MEETKLNFTNIASEQYRVYVFVKDGKTVEIKIDQPTILNVSASGGHRILDESGVSHYIPSGWIHLYWQVKEGQPHFVK